LLHLRICSRHDGGASWEENRSGSGGSHHRIIVSSSRLALCRKYIAWIVSDRVASCV
jgi:hypothetical protein